MKIPKDMSLAVFIRKLLAAGKEWKFYKTDEWKDLRAAVLDEFHWECQECLKKGRYARADCVHHINEIRHRPELALSKFYMDSKGRRKRNLIPLCNKCHNIVHDKRGGRQQPGEKFTNTERW